MRFLGPAEAEPAFFRGRGVLRLGKKHVHPPYGDFVHNALANGGTNPAIIWLAGTDVTNSLDSAEGQALTAHAQQLADFVNSGGGLMSHGHGPIAYGWLTALLPSLKEIDGVCNSRSLQ